MSNNYFIVGTGRSGTHWLGYILEKSSEMNVQIEEQPIFKWVTQAAINKNKRKYLLPMILAYYNMRSMFSTHHFVDKSHPNLWLVDHLIRFIPNSYFIGILRNPYATISSMLLHKGVMKWIENWSDFPIPNEFLGISESNIDKYASMSIEEKCAMRWLAHKQRLNKMHQKYPERFLIVNYNRLIDDTDTEMEKMNNFLDLAENLPKPKIKKESKDKWKRKLLPEQVEKIDRFLTMQQAI